MQNDQELRQMEAHRSRERRESLDLAQPVGLQTRRRSSRSLHVSLVVQYISGGRGGAEGSHGSRRGAPPVGQILAPPLSSLTLSYSSSLTVTAPHCPLDFTAVTVHSNEI